MKILSWNVNGLRAAVKKDFALNMKTLDADVICLQETKAQPDEVIAALVEMTGYHIYPNSAEKKGYSSTAILSKEKISNLTLDLGVEEHDNEGRVISAEFPEFYIVTAYVPNSGRKLVRLDYRMRWDQDLLKHIQNLQAKKPVILCGDLNVAHQAIDLANPKSNYNKTAGYTQDEIDGFDHMLSSGFVDIYRSLNPDTIKYSWWSYMFNSRAKNVGWRLDYFMACPTLLAKVRECEILNDIYGSDHCPILLEIQD
ncbi:UNVERIFIED_CONTAM: hypothetical protein GTU68_051440 [Idotea baltica]|nr:hypothetical protein [Idotea baltica]